MLSQNKISLEDLRKILGKIGQRIYDGKLLSKLEVLGDLTTAVEEHIRHGGQVKGGK